MTSAHSTARRLLFAYCGDLSPGRILPVSAEGLGGGPENLSRNLLSPPKFTKFRLSHFFPFTLSSYYIFILVGEEKHTCNFRAISASLSLTLFLFKRGCHQKDSDKAPLLVEGYQHPRHIGNRGVRPSDCEESVTCTHKCALRRGGRAAIVRPCF